MADRPLQLCVIEGDGVGHEVIPAALDVLAATKLVFDIRHAEAGWACFQAHGTALPEATLDVARHADAVLFGAVSSPSHRVAGYSSPIVELRRKLDLFANLRPSVSWPIPTLRRPHTPSSRDTRWSLTSWRRTAFLQQRVAL